MFDQQPCSDAPTSRPWLHVLGGFGLRVLPSHESDPRPLTADERRLLALLAVAAIPRGVVELATVLWPERSADVALGTLAGVCDSLADLVTVAPALSPTVSRAAETGQPGSGSTVALSEDVDTDLAASLRRLRAWRRAPAAVEASAGSELVEALSEDLLPGWGEVWARQERDRFRRVRLHALESLCRRLTESGRHAPAIRAGELVVAAEPLRESARRALIEAHLAAGNVAEAVTQHDAFAEVCAKFGMTPAGELSSFFPPTPAWPVLHVRRPIHLDGAVGRGLRLDQPSRRTHVGVGAVGGKGHPAG